MSQSAFPSSQNQIPLFKFNNFPLSGPIDYRKIVLRSALSSDALNFAHINPGSLKKNLHDVLSLINDTELHVLAVSETWFNESHNNNLLLIPNFKLIRHDRKSKRGGGVAFYLRYGIKYKIIAKSHHCASTEFLFVEIINGINNKILLGVVYNPPRSSNLKPLCDTLTDLSSKYEDIILLGDFNFNLLAPSSLAIKFCDFLSGCLLECTSTIPTNFVQNCSPSLIDLLIVKNKSKLIHQSQIPLGSFTSHDMIFGTYDFKFHYDTKFISMQRRNLKSLNPEILQVELSKCLLDNIYSIPDIDEQVEFLTSSLFSLLERFAPLRQYRFSHEAFPEWLNSEIRHLINVRDYHHHVMRHGKSHSDRAESLKLYKKFRNKITMLKRDSMRKHYSKLLDTSLPSGVLWNNLKKCGVTNKRSDQTFNFSPTEVNSHFSNVFSKRSDVAPSSSDSTFTDSDSSPHTFELQTITENEVLNAINLIKSQAVGWDEIPIVLIKSLCPFILPFLTYIVNQCITKSYFPKKWKIAIVKPIPKVPHPMSTNDLRPISILPCFSKILERISKEQIESFINSKKLLSPHQTGFRSGHSTNTALLAVTNEISEAIESSNVSVLVLLDLKKAFDLVDHSILLVKLSDTFNFSPRSVKFIRSFLTHRLQAVKIGDECSSLSEVTSGVPQGGIISTLLFSLYINDLPAVTRGETFLYADDTQILNSAPGNDFTDCIEKVNQDLKRVDEWSVKNHITINPEKSVALAFANFKFDHSQLPKISLCGHNIEYRQKTRNLGLILDDKCSFVFHVDHILQVVYSGLNMLRQSQFFTPIHTRRHLVKALLLPIFTYCSNIFMALPRSQWDRLNICFNACTRYVHGLRKFDSISGFKGSILGCDLETYMKFRSCTFIHKLIQTKSPDYLFKNIHLPRIPRHRALATQSHKKSIREKSFFIYSVKLWNNLPDEIRDILGFGEFSDRCWYHLTQDFQ